MTTAQERKFLQLYRDTDEAGRLHMMDLLYCFVYCGDEFIKEIKEAQPQGTESMLVTVVKWKTTIPAEVVV